MFYMTVPLVINFFTKVQMSGNRALVITIRECGRMKHKGRHKDREDIPLKLGHDRMW